MELKIKQELEEKLKLYIDYVKQVNNGHVGGTLSVAHTFIYLTFCVTNKTKELIIFSKGHASLGVYIMDVIKKKINIEKLIKDFEADGSSFSMIARRDYSKEVSCFGNLGNGISYAVGKAIGRKNEKIFCFVGDGEINEGLCWEAFMSANKFKLKNLYAIIDCNKFSHDGRTDDIMPLGNVAEKMKAFGFDVAECNGHDFDAIDATFSSFFTKNNESPKCIVLDTIKAFGIKELENTIESHSL